MRALSPYLPRLTDRRGRVALVAVATAAAAMLLGSGPPRAEALCIARPEYGAWINANRTSPGIASLRLIQGDSCGTFAQVWGKCSPTNCDWGLERRRVPGLGHGLRLLRPGLRQAPRLREDVRVPARPALGALGHGLRRPVPGGLLQGRVVRARR